jgi:hypothetical protein
VQELLLLLPVLCCYRSACSAARVCPPAWVQARAIGGGAYLKSDWSSTLNCKTSSCITCSVMAEQISGATSTEPPMYDIDVVGSFKIPDNSALKITVKKARNNEDLCTFTYTLDTDTDFGGVQDLISRCQANSLECGIEYYVTVCSRLDCCILLRVCLARESWPFRCIMACKPTPQRLTCCCQPRSRQSRRAACICVFAMLYHE